jgi:HEAT repeat protein
LIQSFARPASAGTARSRLHAPKHPESSIRTFVTKALAAIGPAASIALPAVIEESKTMMTRHGITRSRPCPQIGAVTAADLPALMDSLADRNVESIRPAAVELVGELGPAAAGAIPKLIEFLSDPRPFSRAAAATALGGMGAAALGAVEPLIEARLPRQLLRLDPFDQDASHAVSSNHSRWTQSRRALRGSLLKRERPLLKKEQPFRSSTGI